MTKSDRLALLIKIAQHRERTWAGSVKESLARRSAHQVKLARLNGYRTQYQAALLPGHGELSARQLKDLWRFVSTLDEAITHGTRQALQSQEDYARCQRSFMTAHARTKVLESLMSRYRFEERSAALRRENKEHDEVAQRVPRDRGF